MTLEPSIRLKIDADYGEVTLVTLSAVEETVENSGLVGVVTELVRVGARGM